MRRGLPEPDEGDRVTETAGALDTIMHYGPGARRVVVVTGGRSYVEQKVVYVALDQLLPQVALVISGDAHGADLWSQRWASDRYVHYARVAALWHVHGAAAGPIRNRAMLALRPDLVVAFPGGAGTADCVAAAAELGLAIWEPAKQPFLPVATR